MSLAIADLNVDGKPDLITQNIGSTVSCCSALATVRSPRAPNTARADIPRRRWRLAT
jgi:hypothetical protein